MGNSMACIQLWAWTPTGIVFIAHRVLSTKCEDSINALTVNLRAIVGRPVLMFAEVGVDHQGEVAKRNGADCHKTDFDSGIPSL